MGVAASPAARPGGCDGPSPESALLRDRLGPIGRGARSAALPFLRGGARTERALREPPLRSHARARRQVAGGGRCVLRHLLERALRRHRHRLPPGARHHLRFGGDRAGGGRRKQGRDGVHAASAENPQLQGPTGKPFHHASLSRLPARGGAFAQARRAAMRAALLAGVLFAATAARADYVLVTHETSIFKQPQAASRVLAAAGPGDRLEMVTPRSDSGYYLVRFGDDEDSVGYIYRRFIRARRGDPGFVFRRADPSGTVTGWLLYDAEHENQSAHTAPSNPSDWRATAWEVHPITDIDVGGEPVAAR